MWRVDCLGFSDAGQETRRALKVKVSTWKFELVIVVVLHLELINYRRGDILSDYFEMNILHHIVKWVVTETCDLFSYSVQQNISSLHAWGSIAVGDLSSMVLK